MKIKVLGINFGILGINVPQSYLLSFWEISLEMARYVFFYFLKSSNEIYTVDFSNLFWLALHGVRLKNSYQFLKHKSVKKFIRAITKIFSKYSYTKMLGQIFENLFFPVE